MTVLFKGSEALDVDKALMEQWGGKQELHPGYKCSWDIEFLKAMKFAWKGKTYFVTKYKTSFYHDADLITCELTESKLRKLLHGLGELRIKLWRQVYSFAELICFLRGGR